MTRIFIVYAIVMLLLSCSTTKTQHNMIDKATLLNVAILSDSKKYELLFSRVNGKKLTIGISTEEKNAIFTVDAGLSDIDMRITYSADNLVGVRAAYFRASLFLEKNNTYSMRAYANNKCITMQIVDSRSKVIYGPVSKPHYIFDSGEYLYSLLASANKEESKCLH
ncbi:MAG: hypothetical protein COA99_09445 [Moraxellaceae bacterium]|nr:MAG: hypothetical protein COA99_09445 [Moraxellaceae bacterium]